MITGTVADLDFQRGAIKEINAEVFSATIKFEGNHNMIVVDQTVKLPGWMYFVLSRVKSLNGLFLLQPVNRESLTSLTLNIEKELMWLRIMENDYISQSGNHE